jgi:hypothetical protein
MPTVKRGKRNREDPSPIIIGDNTGVGKRKTESCVFASHPKFDGGPVISIREEGFFTSELVVLPDEHHPLSKNGWHLTRKNLTVLSVDNLTVFFVLGSFSYTFQVDDLTNNGILLLVPSVAALTTLVNGGTTTTIDSGAQMRIVFAPS